MSKIPPARKLAYMRTFCGDGTRPHMDGERVLADLRKFAAFDKPGPVINPHSKVSDPYMTYYRLGQTDLYKRIATHLGLDVSEIFEPLEETKDASAQT